MNTNAALYYALSDESRRDALHRARSRRRACATLDRRRTARDRERA
jgi:hypothetical protein